jgi:hypothetical protein
LTEHFPAEIQNTFLLLQFGGDESGCPGSLKIITASNAVDIHHFPGEIEIFAELALHCIEVDGIQTYATAGDKLIAELGLPLDGINIIRQYIHQLVEAGFPNFTPFFAGWQITFFQQVTP